MIGRMPRCSAGQDKVSCSSWKVSCSSSSPLNELAEIKESQRSTRSFPSARTALFDSALAANQDEALSIA